MRVPPGARIADLLAALGLQDAEPLLVARNGRVAAPEDPLEENDMVWVFPAVGGGA
jgi:sulfur carrier protein ThiS